VVSVSADWSEVPVLRWSSTLGCAICTVVLPFVDESGCLECSKPPRRGSNAQEVAASRAAVAQQHGARAERRGVLEHRRGLWDPAPVRRRCLDRSGRDATPCLLITLVGGAAAGGWLPPRAPIRIGWNHRPPHLARWRGRGRRRGDSGAAQARRGLPVAGRAAMDPGRRLPPS
jgi:hypothetical protein